ncbi:hypothetical protein [Terrabacter terrigena]|uniref:Anti-sigma-D factor RsdA sigma factor binding region domain-containing protein n=1 Tax=Terrabacter terrigena TaxID=574718 RepID=A0ABW3MZP1_9MICO
MNDFSPLGSASDLLADDLLLDRLAGRRDPGGEPVAALLAALAAHADSPLTAHTGRRRIANKHRYLGAFAVLAVAASGAGVAAAVTLPDDRSMLANRARIEQRMEQNARSDAPSALLSRLGLPATGGTTAARDLVLARGANGTFVLLPAATASARAETAADGGEPDGLAEKTAAEASDAGVTDGNGAVEAGAAAETPAGAPVAGPTVPSDKAPRTKPAKPVKVRPATGAAAGNGQAANGQPANGQAANGQGANGQGADTTAQTGSDPVWVVAPPTGSSSDPAGSAVSDPSTQQSLVGPSTTPPANRRAVVPGVGPSVTPGAARPSRSAAPQATSADAPADAAAPSAARTGATAPDAAAPVAPVVPVAPTP